MQLFASYERTARQKAAPFHLLAEFVSFMVMFSACQLVYCVGCTAGMWPPLPSWRHALRLRACKEGSNSSKAHCMVQGSLLLEVSPMWRLEKGAGSPLLSSRRPAEPAVWLWSRSADLILG